MKKFFSLVLALVMALSLATVAWGADEKTVVNATSDTDIANALANTTTAELVINLPATTGDAFFTIELYTNYNASIKSLTINGTDKTKVKFANQQVRLVDFDKFTIDNCEILHMKTKTWGHIVFGGSKANGVYTISNCLFNGVGTQGIYFNPDSNATWVVKECEFNGDFGAEGAVVLQNNSKPTNLTVTNNDFNVAAGSEELAIHYHKEALTLNADVDETVLIWANSNFETAVATAEAGDTFKLMGNLDLTANPVEITTPVTIVDNGKTLTGLAAGSNITTDANGKITGGTFAGNVSSYLAPGLTLTDDGVVVAEGGTALGTKYDLVTTDVSATKTVGVTVATFKAKAPKDTNKDGVISAAERGCVKYVVFSNMNNKYFVQVNTVSEADYTVYQTGTKTLFGYFNEVASPFYYGTGVAFNNFGEKCGQLDTDPVADAKYYSFQDVVYVADPTYASTTNLMVNNVLTPVTEVAAKNSADWVAHVPEFTYDKDYKVVGVKCAECGVAATLYANYAAVPKADKAGAVGLAGGQYYVWTATKAAASGVTSAKTFDAGVALYAGMALMSVAGSAVVIGKKKEF